MLIIILMLTNIILYIKLSTVLYRQRETEKYLGKIKIFDTRT